MTLWKLWNISAGWMKLTCHGRPVREDEVVFHRVTFDHQPQHYFRDKDGQLQLSRSAFEGERPSMDRKAIIWNGDPTWTQMAPEHGVVALPVAEVRNFPPINSGPRERPDQHSIDVVPDPLRDNPAHAEVVLQLLATEDVQQGSSPSKASLKKALKAAKTLLADLGNQHWIILPKDHRDEK